MKIPSTQKLIVENFPEQKEWIPPMFSLINKFISDVIASVNGGLEFDKNIAGMERDIDLVYISHAVSFPQVFGWQLAQKPAALYVVSAFEAPSTNIRNFSPIMVYAGWKYNDQNQVEITDMIKLSGSSGTVSSLTANNRYKIKVRVTP
jgi:hypothetical protein